MTKGEILDIFKSLQALGNLKGVKFAYAVSRNMTLIEKEIKALEKSIEPSKDFADFESKRIELCKSHAKKDKDGREVIENDNYAMADLGKFTKEFGKLKKEYSKAITGRQKQIAEFNELLKSESDIVFYKIKIEHVPDEITVSQMSAIKHLIDEK